MKKWIFVFLLASSVFGHAQTEDELNRELRLIVDNDVFISLFMDRYYSSGLFGIYRYYVKDRSTDQLRKIRSFSLNQRMYTPQLTSWEDAESMDRPYAGQVSVSGSQENYYQSSQYLKLQLELGWMGPGSLTGDIQETWHKWFGLPDPLGWKHQINDSPIVNLYATYSKTIVAFKDLDVIPESNLSIGTAFTHLRQEIMIRTGKIKPIERSVHYNGLLGLANPKSALANEIYIFYSPGMEYVFYNSTIEGNIVGNESDYTETPNRWILQHRGGFMTSWNIFDLQVFYYWRKPETTESRKTKYVGLHLNYRF